MQAWAVATLLGLAVALTCDEVNCTEGGQCINAPAQGCQHNGTCRHSTNVPPSFYCDCLGTGYEGTLCQTTLTNSWSSFGPCSKLCGSGNKTRVCSGTCANDQYGGATVACNTQPCVNCSFYWGQWTRCSKSCGTGSRSRSNNINVPASPGAPIQCPPLEEEEPCNTHLCQALIEGIGYWFWKVCGPTEFSYTIGSLTGRALDVFLFREGQDWDAYRRDVSRNKDARNYGYTPVLAQYDTENCKGTFPLEDACYYFVVDYSYVGDAKEKPEDWTQMRFVHDLRGGDWGPGESAASHLMLSPFVFCFIALASLSLWA